MSDGCSGEKIDCIMQFIPPGLQNEWHFAAGSHPGQFPFPFKASYGGLYSSERTTLESVGSFGEQGLSPQPRCQEDTALACCASAMGYLQGKLCVQRVSSPQAWPQESKLLKEHPQEGCTPGGEWNHPGER